MACTTAVQTLVSKTAHRSRLMGGCGATIGLLLPKCPLCWMVIAGSATVGGAIERSFEALGVALFAVGLWKLLCNPALGEKIQLKA